MLTHSAYGAPPPPPKRVVTLFFGLGIPKELTAAGLTGVLEPLSPFASKLALIRGLDLVGGGPSTGNHDVGSSGVFVGAVPRGSRSGGPSIDRQALRSLHPSGSPTVVETLVMGTFHRQSGLNRHIHSWKEDGSPTAAPIESPQALFDRVFGSANPPGPMPGPQVPPAAVSKRERYQRSILDSVIREYEHYKSEASNLGASSRARIADHLEKVRELERRVNAMASQAVDGGMPIGGIPTASCQRPARPPVVPPADLQRSEEGGDVPGALVQVAQWEALWRLLADIFVVAFQCDVTRFGNAQFQSGGERIRLQGDYRWNNRLIYSFNDTETTHEYWHRYRATDSNTLLKHHAHFMMAQLGYLLGKLDDPSVPDSNGKTILENALVMIGTELGDGNPHTLEDVVHLISSANGALKVGNTVELPARTKCPDLYNTCLSALGVNERIGDMSQFKGILTGLLA
jgi:hypothetical protein